MKHLFRKKNKYEQELLSRDFYDILKFSELFGSGEVDKKMERLSATRNEVNDFTQIRESS